LWKRLLIRCLPQQNKDHSSHTATNLGEDDVDFQSTPGDLMITTTKLQELKDNLDKVLSQIDLVNLLMRRMELKNKRPHGTKGFKSQTLEQVRNSLKEEVGSLTKQIAKCISQEQRDTIQPGLLAIEAIGTYEDAKKKKRESISTDLSGRRGIKTELRDRIPQNQLRNATFYVMNITRKSDSVSWMIKKRYG
jgi:hypothetical protein